MTAEPRTVTQQGLLVSLSSTREVALDAAIDIFRNSIDLASYKDKTAAEIVVAEAEIIEKYLDRPEPQTGESAQSEDTLDRTPDQVDLFLKSLTGEQASRSVTDLYRLYMGWSDNNGTERLSESGFRSRIILGSD